MSFRSRRSSELSDSRSSSRKGSRSPSTENRSINSYDSNIQLAPPESTDIVLGKRWPISSLSEKNSLVREHDHQKRIARSESYKERKLKAFEKKRLLLQHRAIHPIQDARHPLEDHKDETFLTELKHVSPIPYEAVIRQQQLAERSKEKETAKLIEHRKMVEEAERWKAPENRLLSFYEQQGALTRVEDMEHKQERVVFKKSVKLTKEMMQAAIKSWEECEAVKSWRKRGRIGLLMMLEEDIKEAEASGDSDTVELEEPGRVDLPHPESPASLVRSV